MNSSFNYNGSETRRNVTEAACFYSDPILTKIVRVIAYGIIFTASLLGNTVVVASVTRNKAMRRTVNYFIMNMSIADLFVTVTYMPRVVSLSFAGYAWQVRGLAGLAFCKIACFNEVAILVAIFTIIAISIDRFLAVTFPLRRGLITIRICKTIIVCIWIVAFGAAFVEFYAIELREFRGDTYCYLDLDYFFGEGSSKAFYKFIIIGFFAIPFTTIVILYTGIIIVLAKQRKIPGDTSTVTNTQKKRREETRKKVLKMVMIVVGTFVLCWLLYFIHFIVYSYGITLPCDVMFLRLILAHFHCAFSPFIYGFYNGNFRNRMLNFIPSSRRTTEIALNASDKQFRSSRSVRPTSRQLSVINEGFEQEQSNTNM